MGLESALRQLLSEEEARAYLFTIRARGSCHGDGPPDRVRIGIPFMWDIGTCAGCSDCAEAQSFVGRMTRDEVWAKIANVISHSVRHTFGRDTRSYNAATSWRLENESTR
jgi:hypothetical protein